MIKPDVIVTWPRNCDYPLWRQFIHDERTRFNEIIIIFMETHQGHDYREFIRNAMLRDYVHCVNSPTVDYGSQDWRNVAIHAGLIHSYNAEWLWFTEQDFIIKDVNFWTDLENAEQQGCEVVGVLDSMRLHPCSLFMKRSALEKTGKNFGIVPDKLDHFGLIQKNIEELKLKTGIISEDRYTHLAGLSHNMHLLGLGEAPNHQKEAVIEWLRASLAVSVENDPYFVDFAQKAIEKFGL